MVDVTGNLKTPEEINDINKSRKLYEKDVNKLTDSELSMLIKKLLGNAGIVSKFEIIYSDAEYENSLRVQGRKYEAEDEGKSSLIKTKRKESVFIPPSEYADHFVMRGIIDEKEVEIYYDSYKDNYWGKIEGQKIKSDQAKLIWEKYEESATKRSERIEEIRYGKVEKNSEDNSLEFIE